MNALTRPLLLAALALGLAIPAHAQAPAAPAAASPELEAEAGRFIRTFLDDLAAVAKGSGTQAEKDAKVRALVGERLAVDRIGRYLIGANAAKATPEQLARYNRLVPTYVADEFGDRIDELAVQNPKVGTITMRGASEARVASEFRRKKDQSQVKVDWRVAKVGSDWKLMDVYVNGVSRLVIRRQEFGSVVERQGFEALLKYMESRSS